MSAPHDNNWIETTFGAVVENVSINHKKLPKSHYAPAGQFPVVDQGQDFIGGYSDDQSKVVDRDLPLLVFGDHTRVFKYLDRPFIKGADGVKVLKPTGVNPKWLFHAAHSLDFPDKGYARHFQHLKAARLLVPPIEETNLSPTLSWNERSPGGGVCHAGFSPTAAWSRCAVSCDMSFTKMTGTAMEGCLRS